MGGGAGGVVPYVLLAQRAPRLDVGRGLVRVRVGVWVRVRQATRLWPPARAVLVRGDN